MGLEQGGGAKNEWMGSGTSRWAQKQVDGPGNEWEWLEISRCSWKRAVQSETSGWH
ncbi:hypothetical protein PAXRUDRAFT_305971 [Paxillus rubicundulus Ve08.2h10]|uniref:Uncharacterized protein n=1 Tax=Paxillus rubicundulus Ve08.2h10 TaxID=930991 RepID=A0A0D0DKW5_9AGAM|nr:hypothetical protein PAXRUDRAFT_305971 [Paxillus rubicundulus Ve08.2h10]